MLIIGLTGGIGSGKSAASEHFETLGIKVVDADVVAREVVEPGTAALNEIAAHFGASVITESGELDRKAMRALVFSNPEKKKWLETLLHPIIRQETIRQLESAAPPYAILVSPLLFETDQHQLVARTLLIDVPEALQVARASSRDDTSEEQIKAIIAQQMSRECKRQKADDIIVNDQDLAHLRDQVEAIHQRYLELANVYKTTGG